LRDIERSLPYLLLGIASDNGSEFINHQLIRYCAERQITFTRSRPHRKNRQQLRGAEELAGHPPTGRLRPQNHLEEDNAARASSSACSRGRSQLRDGRHSAPATWLLSVKAMHHREVRMPDRSGWSKTHRPLAALVVVCLLAAGCTAEGGELLSAGPTPANAPTPAAARSSGALAYGVDGDIFVAEWDGSNAVRIADGGEEAFWSPDGRYLAYRNAARGDEVPTVIISDPKGNVVTSFPGEGWLVSWSPDSTRVAVWVRLWETIGIYGLDGEREAMLTVPPGMMAPGDFDPVWSRDGAAVLVPRGVEVPLDGSTARQLPSSDPRVYSFTTYSPDGSHVAYTVNGSLVVAEADGSDVREVAAHRVRNPVWSPTGDRIAFDSNARHSNRLHHQLLLLDVATGTVTVLVDKGGSEWLSVIDFSPEDDRILFSRTEDEGAGVSSLWSINADGSDLRRLVPRINWAGWRPPSAAG
jgi:WD40-like Beta Propeller Repeat